ncbi:malonate--CoA ligase [Aureimonas mangrovi]|uniref:malonate--CoA ligase n=1 Tax=Aureimonas mangrovi TaxID=2758041 RepID=UPI00163D9B32|nr:malonyl-CoA synthase [Aureimonas mangrovi]
MTDTIYTMFAASAARDGAKALFRRPGRPNVTYDEALETTHRLAGALHELGIRPGDRVAVQVEKSTEAVCLYLATLQVGAIFLPLNTAYTGGEIDYFLGDAEPALFVCSPGEEGAHAHRRTATMHVETLGAEADGSLMQRAERAAPSAEVEPVGARDAAAILYTSGTTGRSKGAVLTHENLTSNCCTLLETWRFTQADRLIHALPIFHIHGLFVACNMALAAGATMIFLTRFDADEVLDEMADASVLMGVPTFYTRLLRSPRLDAKVGEGMRLFVSGSAPLSAEDHSQFEKRTGHAILERYGMTEAGMITSNPYEGARKPGAVGRPLPGIELRVTDRESGEALTDGEIGAVEVRGPNVFREYWRMPEKTAAEFREDGFFKTGDVGSIDEDGYLRIVGRDKDLVISGGYNVYPKEVETLIDALPGVEESAVIGLPHPDFGEAVTAIVVPKGGANVDERETIAAVAGSLARYKQPKRVIVVDALPRNVMGKVQKAELRKRFADLYAEGQASAAQ